jgi:DNA polymerase III subunit alpha
MNGNANALALRSVLEAYRAKPEDAESAAPAPAARSGGRGGFNGDSGRSQRPSAPMPNGLAVQIVYRSDNAEGEVRLGDAWRVKPTDELLAALRTEFSGSAIEIVY